MQADCGGSGANALFGGGSAGYLAPVPCGMSSYMCLMCRRMLSSVAYPPPIQHRPVIQLCMVGCVV